MAIILCSSSKITLYIEATEMTLVNSMKILLLLNNEHKLRRHNTCAVSENSLNFNV